MNTHKPRLETVKGHSFSVKCRHCGAMMGAGDGFEAVADLNGTPWTAYFHGDQSHDCSSHAGEYPIGDGVGFRHKVRQ